MTLHGRPSFELGRTPDFTVPSAARMYDYFLGGKNNFRADREAADKVIEAFPETRRLALANRRFLTRAVWYLADHGVRQFIDLGSGMPTSPNVHEVARQVRPDARVVYVDSDPVVASHGRVLCDSDHGVAFAEQDIRHPQAILHDARLTSLIDFSAPVAVLTVSVLHFIQDEDNPGEILAAFRSRMTSGSYLVLSHATSDGADERVLSEIASVYKESTVRAVPRTTANIKEFLTGLDLVEPGLVDVSQWRGDTPAKPTKIRFLAGVGRKRRDLPTRHGTDCIIDPTGNGPRFWFQMVPDVKTVKNRLHLDVHASGGRAVPLATRRERVDAEARRLASLGATILSPLGEEEEDEADHYAVAMKDPEGNEFDIN
jgi:hypothetical protein